MKKILVIFLLFTLTPGVFAEFYWSVDSLFSTSLFSLQIPLGERAEKTITINDSFYYNDNYYYETERGPANPYNPNNLQPYGITRGTYTHFSETTNFFSYGRGVWLMPNQLRLAFGYRNDNVEFFTRVYLDRLVRINEVNANEGNGKNEWNAGESDHSFVVNDGRSPNWGMLFLNAFEEWYVRGTAGFLTGYVGITHDRGKVKTFNNQSESLLRGIQVDNYGVLAPTADADFVHDGLDTNNLLRSGAPYNEALQQYATVPMNFYLRYTSMPYFMIAADLGRLISLPLTIQIAADPGNNGGIGSEMSYTRMHGALRVSGEVLLNRINFDVIYKIAGGDPATAETYDPIFNPNGTILPSGDGFLVHNFGVYANIMDIFGFNFGLGYSGYLKTYEDYREKDTGQLISITGPLFSGIDLRIQYTGFDKFVITSFNNVSFGKSDTSSADKWVFGVTNKQLPVNTAQDWLAMFNSLTVVYNPTNVIAISAQIGNRYGIINTNIFTTGAESAIERSRMQLGGGIFAAYDFPLFDLQLGVAFRRLIESYSNSGTTNSTQIQTIGGFREATGGSFDFAIPIQVTFSF